MIFTPAELPPPRPPGLGSPGAKFNIYIYIYCCLLFFVFLFRGQRPGVKSLVASILSAPPIEVVRILLGGVWNCSTMRALRQKPLRSGARFLIFCGFGFLFGRFPWVSGRASYPPGSILGSVFLWLCFCRQKLPCSPSPGTLRKLESINIAQKSCPEGGSWRRDLQ